MINRRKLMSGGAMALGAVVVPSAAFCATAGTTPEAWQTHFEAVFERLAKKIIGRPEKGPYLKVWKHYEKLASSKGVWVDEFHGTICGASTDRVSIVDAIWWRVGVDNPYQELHDERWWRCVGHRWVMRTDLPFKDYGPLQPAGPVTLSGRLGIPA